MQKTSAVNQSHCKSRLSRSSFSLDPVLCRHFPTIREAGEIIAEEAMIQLSTAAPKDLVNHIVLQLQDDLVCFKLTRKFKKN